MHKHYIIGWQQKQDKIPEEGVIDKRLNNVTDY